MIFLAAPPVKLHSQIALLQLILTPITLLVASGFGFVDRFTSRSYRLRRQVEGYTGQRQAHVAAFGPVRLALEASCGGGRFGRWYVDMVDIYG